MKKLDLENVRVYSCTKDDVIDAIDLIGEKVFVSDTKDFEEYYKHKLMGIQFEEDSSYAFMCFDDCQTIIYKYFILAKDVKFKEEEKKLRPYKDVEELFRVNGLELGKTIRYREKGYTRECVIVLNGYTSDNLVMLGGAYRTLSELFNYYEYYDNVTSEWKPFGVEE